MGTGQMAHSQLAASSRYPHVTPLELEHFRRVPRFFARSPPELRPAAERPKRRHDELTHPPEDPQL
jgi:hypothetical protein